MTHSLEEINTKVKAIAVRNPVYAEISQWVGDLLSTTVEASKNFRTSDLKFDFDPLPEAWFQGKSLVNPGELSLDWKHAKELFKQLVDQIKTTEDGQSQVQGLIQALAKKNDDVKPLMKAVLSSDFKALRTTARELKIDPPVLTLLIRLSLRPALLDTARSLQSLMDLTKWHYGHCPVCGSAPRLADLSGEGGKRTLHCSLCETAWPYIRLRCPFCENDDKEELSYLRGENEVGLRVDLCGRCSNYLKTIDLREIPGQIILPLDDVATWHLDIIAGKHLEDKDSD